MRSVEPARTTTHRTPMVLPVGLLADGSRLGITVFGCEPDEADVFRELSPRFGVVPTITSDPVSEAGALSLPGNRCISVGHKAEVSLPMLRALKATGVEYISTRSIGFDHIDLH